MILISGQTVTTIGLLHEHSPSTSKQRIALHWPWRRTGTGTAPTLSAAAHRLLLVLIEESGRAPRDANRGGAFAAAWEKLVAVGTRAGLLAAGRNRNYLDEVGWDLRATECVTVGADGAILTEAGMRATERTNAAG